MLPQCSRGQPPPCVASPVPDTSLLPLADLADICAASPPVLSANRPAWPDVPPLARDRPARCKPDPLTARGVKARKLALSLRSSRSATAALVPASVLHSWQRAR